MYKLVSDLIANGDIKGASLELSKLMERDGFNEQIAILLSSINFALGDMEGGKAAIEKGLKLSPGNYELHLMLGDCNTNESLETALKEYDLALAYARFSVGEGSSDYQYIFSVREGFCKRNKKEIDKYISQLPILIYKSESICFGVLNRFADMMKECLLALGEKVEVIDVNQTPPESIAGYCGRRYKAILGIQTYLFSMHFNDGRNIHDYIFGPKYNMIFDHPCCMYNHLTKGPLDYHVLIHDRNYYKFIKEYYPSVSSVSIFPPAGERFKGRAAKEYPLTFIGSYKDPDTWDLVIKELDEKYHGKAGALVEYMYQNPNQTYEEGLLSMYGKEANAEVFYDLKQTYFVVMSRIRKEILLNILDAGLELHVFGDSFDNEVFSCYENLHIHKELTPEESIEVYAKSKATLNIMSWHKDGRTERVANAMLNFALVVTDRCDYLCEEYSDNDDIILFDLKDYSDLGERIQKALDNQDKLYSMVDNAFNKAINIDTWEKRAEEFLSILSDYYGEN